MKRTDLRRLFGRIPLIMMVFALSVFLLGGCGGSDDPAPGPKPDPVKAGLVTVSGQVVDSVPAKAEIAPTARSSAMRVSLLKAGAGVEGVEVDASSDGFSLGKTTTEKNGFFALEVPVPSNGRLVLTFSKAGHITYQKAVNVAKDESHAVHAVHAVLPKVDTKTVSPDGVVSGDAIRIDSLPAGEEITLFTGDPTDETGRAVFPGDYMASTPEEGDVGLVSMAFFEAKFTDDAAAGAKSTSLETPARVRMLLPEGYQDGTLRAPDGRRYDIVSDDKFTNKIEWWSYDTDTAMWVQEDADPLTPEMDLGTIIRNPDDDKLYVEAWVTHFSWWNADYPQEFAYFCVRVVDGDGNPLENIPVFSRGVTYMNTSRGVRTDTNGWAKGIVVKKSASDAKPTRERAQVFAMAGNVEFLYPGEGVVASDDLYTPFDEDECERADKRPSIKLDNTIVVSFEGTVKGTVTNDAGKTLAGVNVYSSTGGVATTNAGGEYSLKVPVGADVMIYVAGVEGKNATVADKGTPVVVDFKVPNRPPVITKFSRTPEGRIPSGGVVTFTGEAIDPEGGAVTYKWTATAGTLATDTNPTSIWTAPSTFQGSAQVTLTATDADGKQSQMTVPVLWGPLPRPGRLIVTLVDDDNPIAGAPVVLHAPDGSVEREILTNVLGKADFGEIGRDKATISYGVEKTNVYNQGAPWEQSVTSRVIRTITDAPAAAIVVDHGMDLGGGEERYYGFWPDAGDPVYTLRLGVDRNSIPSGTYAQIQPLYTSFYDVASVTPSEVEWKDDVRVFAEQLQSDGKLTLLGQVLSFDTYELRKWGAVYDIEPVSGDSYTVPLDRNPVSMTWTSNRETPLFWIMGDRKGVEYQIARTISDEEPWGEAEPRSFADRLADRAARRAALLSAPAATGGSLQVPAFEADFFYYDASGFVVVSPDISTVSETRRLGSTLPASVAVELPYYAFSNVTSPDFGEGDREIGWRLEAENDFDALIASISGGYQQAQFEFVDVEWSVIRGDVKGNRTLVFPQLPNSLEDWLKQGSDGDYIQFSEPIVSVYEFNNVAGYDALMGIILSGNNPQNETIRMLRGSSGSYIQ